MNGSLVLSLVGLVLSGISLAGYAQERKEVAAERDHTCIVTALKLAQATADLARTEGDIRAMDEDQECDLACAALERHRGVLMSEIRDYYKVLRDHECKVKDEQ